MKKNNWKSMVGCTVATMTICMGATALAADTNVFVGKVLLMARKISLR